MNGSSLEDLDYARSSSILSESSVEEEVLRNSVSSVKYAQEASMEAIAEDRGLLKLQPSGRMGRRHTSVNEEELIGEDDDDEVEESMSSLDLSERGTFEAVQRRSMAKRLSVREEPKVVEETTKRLSESLTSVLIKHGVDVESTCSQAKALHALVEGFCQPPVTLEHCSDMINGQASSLPQDVHFASSTCAAITLLRDPRIPLLSLPNEFVSAFLQLLIRLVTEESTEEYKVSTFSELPKVDSDPDPLAPQPPLPDDPSLRPNILYSMARIRSSNNKSGSDESLLALWDSAAALKKDWLMALSRWMGLWCIPSISTHMLRRMLEFTRKYKYPILGRVSMVAALTTAASGHGPRPSPSPSSFFGFTGGLGLNRSIHGLATWPFRNDFGLALWFRISRLNQDTCVLFEALNDLRGGWRILLKRLNPETVASVDVEIFDDSLDAKQSPAHVLSVSNCVLLPGVWYHLAIRHTNSRMKGVFSLSTRQQLSVLLDGSSLASETVPFPQAISSDPSSFMRRSAANSVGPNRRMSLHVRLGDGFLGETGVLYMFNDSVSDATLKALRNLHRRRTRRLRTRSTSNVESIKPHLDTSEAGDDAFDLEENAHDAQSRKRAGDSTIDIQFDGDTEEQDELASHLKQSLFAAKLFLVWHPQRVTNSLVVELGAGAHASMGDGVFCWDSVDTRDVISDLGGIGSVLPTMQSFLSPQSESQFDDLPSQVLTLASQCFGLLLDMVSSLVREHYDNSRDWMVSKGLASLRDLLLSNKRLLASRKHAKSMTGTCFSEVVHSRRLMSSLLRLEKSCACYPSLSEAVLSSLTLSLDIWCSGKYTSPMSLLISTSVAQMIKDNPRRLARGLSSRLVVDTIHEFLLDEVSLDNDAEVCVMRLLYILFVHLNHRCDSEGVSCFLMLIAVQVNKLNSSAVGISSSVALMSGSVFLVLLGRRPIHNEFYECFIESCGGVSGCVGWILSCFVNAKHDEMRALGIRAVAYFIDATSNGPDTTLSFGSSIAEATEPINVTDGVASNVRRASSRLSRFAVKGLASIPGRLLSTSTKLTPRVVYKLICQILKSNRYHLSRCTHIALLHTMVDDDLENRSTEYLMGLITVDRGSLASITLSVAAFRTVLSTQPNTVALTIHNPLVTATVLRLLRHFDYEGDVDWLTSLHVLAKENKKNVAVLTSLEEWEACLFQFISDTLEQIRSQATHARDDLVAVQQRLNQSLELYASLLGSLLRTGGDKALEAVEYTASLQRSCVNGTEVLLLVLGWFCVNIFEHGTVLEIGSISAEAWKDINLESDSLPLKQSARLVTDAILSNGARGMDIPTAVKSWRSLRHLIEIVVAIVSNCRLGLVDLFDNTEFAAGPVDAITSGLHGIRLADERMKCTEASDYTRIVSQSNTEFQQDGSSPESHSEFVCRRLCVRLAAQALILFDAFVFPESLDTSLPASQIHGLDLVRDSEARLGSSQGPVVSSAIRLSLVLLAVLEPSSVKFLQCISRLRCLLSWTLELIREKGVHVAFAEGGVASLDRLLLMIILHCHRALAKCSALLGEIEASSHEVYFESKDDQRRCIRRVVRAVLDIRDIVSATFRERYDVLSQFLSQAALASLRLSLEGKPKKGQSKDAVALEFLSSTWVSSFQDVENYRGTYIPEQLESIVQVDSSQSTGKAALEATTEEIKTIIADFEKALDDSFTVYLELQRKWTETDAIRELEFSGDTSKKVIANRVHQGLAETMRDGTNKKDVTLASLKLFEATVVRPWQESRHFKVSRLADQLGRRSLLDDNDLFSSHKEASYENSLGAQQPSDTASLGSKRDLTEVMKRNAEAFTRNDTNDVEEAGSDDDSLFQSESDGESSHELPGTETTSQTSDDEAFTAESGSEDGWDKIKLEEIRDVGADGDSDKWAKSFSWEPGELVVARFDSVQVLNVQCTIEGKLLVSSHALYFVPTGDAISVMTKEKVVIERNTRTDRPRTWKLSRLEAVYGRRYLLQPHALELFFADLCDLFLIFPGGSRDRDRFYAKIRHSCKAPLLWSLKSLSPRSVYRKTIMTDLWRKKKISTFEYLMVLNRIAGRSFNDVTQYPVFPWVLADYTSDSIDLNDSRVFRDLSKPIGALNDDRLSQLLERYNDLELFGFSEEEKFLYGSHYSSPGIVLHFMVRQEPFTTMAIQLQSGRFDCPDRLFYDIASSWNGCMTSSSDMKELIPELFCLPEMLTNTNQFPLGRTQSGIEVNHVGLPPWAKGSAHEFIRINRLALESDFVSQNLHHWIDLVFGFKQRGPEAEAAHNLFHHLSYEGAVDLDKITDEVDRAAAESHIQNFGQTPSQLSVIDPHPPRYASDECWRYLISDVREAGALRCYTPAKQFAIKRSEFARGAAIKLIALADFVYCVYADFSLGSYRWYPQANSNRLRMEKLTPFPTRKLSLARDAVKKGSEIPDTGSSQHDTTNHSFAVCLADTIKDHDFNRSYSHSEELTEANLLIASCGYWDNCLKLSTADGNIISASDTGGHRGPIKCIAHHKGGWIATGGQDATVRVWLVNRPDLANALAPSTSQKSLRCCRVLFGHDAPIECLDMNAELDVVVSGSLSRVCVHRLRRGDLLRSMPTPAGLVRLVKVGETGVFVCHTANNGLHTMTINGASLAKTDAGERLHDMVLCSMDEFLVTGGDQCRVCVRSTYDLKVHAVLDLQRHGPIRSISITPTILLNPAQQFLFIGSDDGMITVVHRD